MFEETARLKFFIPKPFMKGGRYTDKYPFVVCENVSEGNNIVRGKFPDEENAQIFLAALRERYVTAMKVEMTQIINQTVAEQKAP